MLNLENLRVQLRLGRLPLKIRMKNYKKLNYNNKVNNKREIEDKERLFEQVLMKNNLNCAGKLFISEAKEIQKELIEKTNRNKF